MATTTTPSVKFSGTDHETASPTGKTLPRTSTVRNVLNMKNLKCESLEISFEPQKEFKPPTLVKTKSFTYGYMGRVASESDISTSSKVSYNGMNTMFQRLGVEFNSSLFQIPLMTNTRDSLDPKYIAGGSKELGKVLTSGADHLQLLLNVCVDQYNKNIPSSVQEKLGIGMRKFDELLFDSNVAPTLVDDEYESESDDSVFSDSSPSFNKRNNNQSSLPIEDPNYSVMRFLEISSAYGELLQLQSQAHLGISVLVQAIYYAFFHLSLTKLNLDEQIDVQDCQESPGSSQHSSNNNTIKNVKSRLEIPLSNGVEQKIKSLSLDESKISPIKAVLQELLIKYYHDNSHCFDFGNPSRSQSFTEISSSNILLDEFLKENKPIELESILGAFINSPKYISLLYSFTQVIRRLGVLLKLTGQLNSALIVSKTVLHIIQVLASELDDYKVDLSLSYASLASILEQLGKFEEAVQMDKASLELSYSGMSNINCTPTTR